MKKIIVGITGASGSILAKRMIETLVTLDFEVHTVITGNGIKVFEYEVGVPFGLFIESLNTGAGKVIIHEETNMFSEIASGSFSVDAMVVLPCSMGTLAKISHGISDNLLCRAADVILKERKDLVIVPRETPLSSIHLKNMLTLSNLGVLIMPPMPAYYNAVETVSEMTDITIGRILQTLGIENSLHKIWQGKS